MKQVILIAVLMLVAGIAGAEMFIVDAVQSSGTVKVERLVWDKLDKAVQRTDGKFDYYGSNGTKIMGTVHHSLVKTENITTKLPADWAPKKYKYDETDQKWVKNLTAVAIP